MSLPPTDEIPVPEPAIDLFADTWSALSAVCHRLDPAEWRLPTECPGWDVQDNVAHLVGLERMLQGHPAPESPDAVGAHVRNDLGRLNEAWVASLRPLSGAEVLEQFDIVAAERLAELSALEPEDWDAQADSPAGNRDTYRGVMGLRVFDSWVHEQDIRRATGQTGHLDGPAAEHSVDHAATLLPYVVAKKAGAPNGAVVTWTLTGAVARTFVVEVNDGRGTLRQHGGSTTGAAEDDPTARIESDSETFVCLLCGRWTAERAFDEQRVTVAGDAALARAVLANAGVMI